MHYLLMYDFVDDYVQRRSEFRDAHLTQAWTAQKRGDMMLAGAFTDPVDGAILIFKGDSPAAAEEFAKNDVYVKNGLVKKWRVRGWTTVVGDQATTPVHPATTAAPAAT
ncbi:MAG TPA: YciI-like protein [Gemmatimonadaceae bacterium]|jgi:hypothetical protein